jgi:hypothetical protein
VISAKVYFYISQRKFVTESRNRGGSPDILINVILITVLANFQAEQEVGLYRGQGD